MRKFSHGKESRKDILATEGHRRTRKKIEAEPRKRGRKDIRLATEGHGISLNKTEPETRKRARKDIILNTEKTGRRKDILAME